MSSILKALRKLEHEKSAMGEGSVDLARDILKRSYEERTTSWLGPVVIVIIVLLLVGFGWWILAPQEPLQPDNRLVPQAAEAVIPLTPVTSNTPPRQSPVIIMPNRGLQQGAKLAEAQQQQAPTPVPDPPASLKPTAVAPLVIPDLVIDEIVFVADPSARLAVINELPVMQGTDIAGARVIEILEDRVRFEFKGVRFEKFKTPSP